MIKRIGKMALTIIIVVGVLKGLFRYNESSDHGLAAFLLAVINGIADITYRWIPTLIDFITQLF